jgi:hypothetical protein
MCRNFFGAADVIAAMRRLALIAGLAAAAAASVAFAATGGTVPHRAGGYADAANRTVRATNERFAVDVRITKNTRTLALHVRGATGPGELKLRMKLDDAKAADGTKIPGMNGAIIVDGPFLYERAPNGMSVGKLHWLRTRIADLGPSSTSLRTIHGLTPDALLQVLGQTRMRSTGDAGVYGGSLAYDNPVVRRGLGALTGDIEFRRLYAMVLVGIDGRVHRVRITGRTADGSAKLRLLAYFYAFDKPVHVQPPAQEAFLDLKQELLAS